MFTCIIMLDILYFLHNFMAEFGSSESRFDVLTPHEQLCSLLLYSKSIVDKVYNNHNMNHPPTWTAMVCIDLARLSICCRC